MSSLQPFDPNTFKQRVHDHIVSTFGSLIPPEQFEMMVNAQVKAFFEDEREWTLKQDGHYGHNFNVNMRVTPFRQMVWERVRKEVNDQLDKQFAEGGG